MADSRIVGYKKIFGLVLPDWVNESVIRNFVLAALSIAVMFLLLIFIVWPNFAVVKAKEEEVVKSTDALELLKNSKAGLDSLRSDLTQEEQKRILVAMPQSYSPDVAIFMLRKISADTGVSIVSYSLPSGTLLDTSVAGVASKGTGEMVSFAAFPIKLTVAAPVESLLQFVASVETALPYGVVSDLNLQEVTKLSRTSSDKTVQLTLEIRFFQATISNVNINKIEPFNEGDLALAKALANYNLLEISEESSGGVTVASGSGEIFGF